MTVGAIASAGGCGGGGGGGGPDNPPPAVVSVQFVDRDGVPLPGVNPAVGVPRNAWIEWTFSAPIDPATAHDPAIQVRFGPYFDATTRGTFHVEGNRVRFDPTLVDGDPRPFGWDGSLEHEIRIPSGVANGDMLRGVDGDAPLSTFSMRFTTTDAWAAESQGPHLVGWHVYPLPVAGGDVDSGARFTLEFDEPMHPGWLAAAVGARQPQSGDAVDLRYVDEASNGAVAGQPIPARLSLDPTATIVTVTPLWSLGDAPYRFALTALSGLRDLAGNALTPSQQLGVFRSVGNGVLTPTAVLGETFVATPDRDPATDADWMGGALRGGPVTTRRAFIQGAAFANADAVNGTGPLALGAYFVSPAPLIGLDTPGQVLPVAAGRRVLLAFSGEEIGRSRGTVVDVAWGPDRNATFAATYPELVVRLGYGASLTLAPTLNDNWLGPPVEVYRGPYGVAQRANVGDALDARLLTPIPGIPAGMHNLFAFRGFVSYPTIAPTFVWDPTVVNDAATSVLLLDVAALPGSTWQDTRAYFLGPAAFGGGFPPGGVPPPTRRVTSTFAGSSADPAGTFVTPNPDPVVCDTAFTIARDVTTATSRFYTPGPTDAAGHAYPTPHSAAPTLGTASDYGPLELLGVDLPSGTAIEVRYQGAMALVADGTRTTVDVGQASTPWTADVDDCDGYPYLRWRLTLRANPKTGARPTVLAVALPVRRLP